MERQTELSQSEGSTCPEELSERADQRRKGQPWKAVSPLSPEPCHWGWPVSS